MKEGIKIFGGTIMSENQDLLKKHGLMIIKESDYKELKEENRLLREGLEKLKDKAMEIAHNSFREAWKEAQDKMLPVILETLDEEGLIAEDALEAFTKMGEKKRK